MLVRENGDILELLKINGEKQSKKFCQFSTVHKAFQSLVREILIFPKIYINLYLENSKIVQDTPVKNLNEMNMFFSLKYFINLKPNISYIALKNQQNINIKD